MGMIYFPVIIAVKINFKNNLQIDQFRLYTVNQIFFSTYILPYEKHYSYFSSTNTAHTYTTIKLMN